jgi:hypothetical protein
MKKYKLLLILFFIAKISSILCQVQDFAIKQSFSISCDSLINLKYDSNLNVLQLVSREMYAHKKHQASYHLEHTDLESFYSNVFYVPIDTLRAYFPNDSLKNFTIRAFGSIIKQKGNKIIPEWNKSHISFDYRIIFCENNHLEAIVIVDDKDIYFLRQNALKVWRLYNMSFTERE